jgi:hypothetical protein
MTAFSYVLDSCERGGGIEVENRALVLKGC